MKVFLRISLFCLIVTLGAARLDAAEVTGRAYYDFGVFAYEEGKYDEAAGHFQKALALDPNDPYFHHYLGRTYLKQERFADARRHLLRARKINPAIPGLTYDVAMVHYQTADYARAAEMFQTILADAPDHVLARYYAGMSLYKQSRYAEAIPFFLEAADASPSLTTNGRYYAGICYQKSGQSEKAVEMFRYVREAADSATVARNAEQWIAAIERGGAVRPYRLNLKLGRRYDDNVVLEPADTDFVTDESDGGTLLFFSGRYDFLRRGPISLGAGYSHYQIVYDDLDAYNLTGSIPTLYGSYRLGDFTLSMSYLPSYYWADGDSYLRRHHLMPAVWWKPADRYLLRFSYHYYDDTYFMDADRSGSRNGVALRLYTGLPRLAGVVYGEVGYEDNAADAGYEDFEKWRCEVGGAAELPFRLTLRGTAEFASRSFGAAPSPELAERDDTRLTTTLSLERPVYFDWLGVSLEYRYVGNDSDNAFYEYDRNMVTLSVTATY